MARTSLWCEPDRAGRRDAFNGLALAIVQAGKQPGEIRVEASSPGLESAAAVVTAVPSTPRPAI